MYADGRQQLAGCDHWFHRNFTISATKQHNQTKAANSSIKRCCSVVHARRDCPLRVEVFRKQKKNLATYILSSPKRWQLEILWQCDFVNAKLHVDKNYHTRTGTSSAAHSTPLCTRVIRQWVKEERANWFILVEDRSLKEEYVRFPIPNRCGTSRSFQNIIQNEPISTDFHT